MTPEESIVVADRTVPMDAMLNHLGFQVYKLPQQIACPIHKLGQETKPSARVYEDNSFVWCFTCSKQYRPTEIWSTQRAISKIEAAQTMLTKWPCDAIKAQEILRHYSVPKKPNLSEATQATLERRLIRYRRKVPLNEYREWAKAVDLFVIQASELPDEEREIALESFLLRMSSKLLVL